jgi:hypothetical protein
MRGSCWRLDLRRFTRVVRYCLTPSAWMMLPLSNPSSPLPSLFFAVVIFAEPNRPTSD